MSEPAIDNQGLEKRFSMRVAAKILQSISTGIYRTPANALKEIVSNAFDADATRVDIEIQTSDSGSVSLISIKDNGSGIHPNDFEFSMTHIGSSLKRLEGDFTPKGRPIIGKIGIGLLAVGQASHQFTFKSTNENYDKIMRAEVDLTPYYDAIKATESLDELEIGNVGIYSEDKTIEENFTQILLHNIREPFAKDLTHPAVSKSKNFDFTSNPSYKEFVNWIDESEIKRDEEMSGFNRFMFELGLLTPVRYLKEGPIRNYEKHGVIKEIKQRLENYNFKVFVNNVEIFKPILYPHTSDGLEKEGLDYKVYEININENLENNKKLSVKGYFYHQAKRLLPWTLRGILLRVNNTGIGTYENRFSKAHIETPIILQQFTGELYTDEGLDDALNIDRNSFFESEPAYQLLYQHYQNWIENLSQDIDKRMAERQASLKEQNENNIEKELEQKIKNMLNLSSSQQYKYLNLSVKTNPFKKPVVKIERTKDKASISVQLTKEYNKTIRNTIVSILIAVQLSLEESKGNKEKFNDIFYNFINNLEI